jgi:hypothetical protein
MHGGTPLDRLEAASPGRKTSAVTEIRLMPASLDVEKKGKIPLDRSLAFPISAPSLMI